MVIFKTGTRMIAYRNAQAVWQESSTTTAISKKESLWFWQSPFGFAVHEKKEVSFQHFNNYFYTQEFYYSIMNCLLVAVVNVKLKISSYKYNISEKCQVNNKLLLLLLISGGYKTFWRDHFQFPVAILIICLNWPTTSASLQMECIS